jgi:hypothetical protein
MVIEFEKIYQKLKITISAISKFFFFLLFILVREPGRAHHASMTAETSVQSVLPNNTLVYLLELNLIIMQRTVKMQLKNDKTVPILQQSPAEKKHKSSGVRAKRSRCNAVASANEQTLLRA